MEFTPLAIAALEPGSTTRTVRDSNAKGFALKVATTGTKTFLYIFKKDGKTRQINLGQFPEVSLDTARIAYLTHKNGKPVRRQSIWDHGACFLRDSFLLVAAPV